MNEVKCEICKKELEGKPAYINTKKVCKKCYFNKRKSGRHVSNHLARNLGFYKIL